MIFSRVEKRSFSNIPSAPIPPCSCHQNKTIILYKAPLTLYVSLAILWNMSRHVGAGNRIIAATLGVFPLLTPIVTSLQHQNKSSEEGMGSRFILNPLQSFPKNGSTFWLKHLHRILSDFHNQHLVWLALQSILSKWHASCIGCTASQ